MDKKEMYLGSINSVKSIIEASIRIDRMFQKTFDKIDNMTKDAKKILK